MTTRFGKRGLATSFVARRDRVLSLLSGGASCQEELNAEIDSPNDPAWLQLSAVLQNVVGKGIATFIGRIRQDHVVVKIQGAEAALKEFTVSEQLEQVPGFIRIACYATCHGTRSYIESFQSVTDATRICKSKGLSMGVLVMPFYPKTSLQGCVPTLMKNGKLAQVVCDVIRNYFKAYTTLKFTHGDLFTKNVVLTNNYTPVIIDFEKSEFGSARHNMVFWKDIMDFLGDIVNATNAYAVDDAVIRPFVIMNLATKTDPTESIVNEMLSRLREVLGST